MYLLGTLSPCKCATSKDSNGVMLSAAKHLGPASKMLPALSMTLGEVSQCDNQGNPKHITLRKSSSTPVGARVVKGGWVGLHGRPGVVGHAHSASTSPILQAIHGGRP